MSSLIRKINRHKEREEIRLLETQREKRSKAIIKLFFWTSAVIMAITVTVLAR